ncbi:MAG TPA: aldehyde dehydrogenase family protein [Thermoplasmataceae archaeon]|nr:aldehyde dehydrogenase family protein [Thermoplasmatales archaeon AK]HLH85944.1 aldehyde dehydrogenase family protein [Thermoplasmataceae archaeon]
MTLTENFRQETLDRLGINSTEQGAYGGKWFNPHGPIYTAHSPIDGEAISKIRLCSREDYEKIVSATRKAFEEWQEIPAPKRGTVIKALGDKLVKSKEDLGRLVTLEIGKTINEGNGEIQEMIDIAYFAMGLSRQLYGLTIASERPNHKLLEQWSPVGIVGVITAFNFPSAVWSWNSMIAAACGDAVLWKPSTKAALVAIGVMKLLTETLETSGAPPIFSLVCGSGNEMGSLISQDKRIPLVSFTGSTSTGRVISKSVAERFGKSILELGGNNAAIVTDKCDMEVALKGVAFGSLATAGQRCTSTRRVIVHDSIYSEFVSRLKVIFEKARIGNPIDPETLVGPLIDAEAVEKFLKAIETARSQGGKVLCGGVRANVNGEKGGNYVVPCLMEATPDMAITNQETFGPLLYVFRYKTLEEAIRIHNSVPQGLSSSIFTTDLREEELFISHKGSDCGIVNVNTSTAGAEIGGAFGGEKETGGGRESGSDAWKNYMRRHTVTINYGKDLPLAQGVRFDV